jgi:hypothetical protein
VECFKLFPIDQHHVKSSKVNRVPGYQDNVVNDECLNFFLLISIMSRTVGNVKRVPGYEDNVVNDECFELFPVDQHLAGQC